MEQRSSRAPESVLGVSSSMGQRGGPAGSPQGWILQHTLLWMGWDTPVRAADTPKPPSELCPPSPFNFLGAQQASPCSSYPWNAGGWRQHHLHPSTVPTKPALLVPPTLSTGTPEPTGTLAGEGGAGRAGSETEPVISSGERVGVGWCWQERERHRVIREV